MNKAVTFIFPHQLFKQPVGLHLQRQVYLVEEYLYFSQYNFNKKKLLLHRASMKYYEHFLKQKGFAVTYIEAHQAAAAVKNLVTYVAQKGAEEIHYVDVADDWLNRRLQKAAEVNKLRLIRHQTPAFLNSITEADQFFESRKRYFQTDFYKAERKKRNILLDTNGEPAGGKWTFDYENRLKIPKGELIPETNLSKENAYLSAGIQYVEKYYPDNYGNTQPPFFKKAGFYPTTHDEAERWLADFLKERFAKFGVYEDAMVKSEGVLFHSVLSPLLNTGLLTPQQVLNETVAAAEKYSIPLNSVEGFIRQIIGWREFIRIVYEREGRLQRTKNYWGFTRKIPASFWKGTTGIHPVDTVIQKVLESGYNHHIERLMVMGNFMLLCEFDPDDVYRWFMEMYIDAYDWVMVPNTYGMTQFADGGLMMTKPYISGSNYLLKMGNWQKGPWQAVWDGLFWRFMHVHNRFFLKNPRLSLLLKTFEKMPAAKQKEHLDNAEAFLSTLETMG